jgi:hypothetical protein
LHQIIKINQQMAHYHPEWVAHFEPEYTITSTEWKYKYTNDNELFNSVPLTGLVNKSSKREVSNRRFILVSS